MNNKHLTLGSLFSGSGGFELGGILAGIKPIWNCEIEPFPIRVTTKRLPFVKHYGDINKLDGHELEPVDIITFGSPCTDLSIAGRRAGLEGSQSGLFHQAIRIIKEMREKTNAIYPRFIVWENVPGAFSSHGGEDFQKVLEEICGICDDTVSIPRSAKWEPAGCIMGDGFSVAWRVLDADAWGVPQRRKRIYLVGHLTGHCAGKVLFESEGVSGYSAEGFAAWQRTACRSEGGVGEPGGAICLNDQGGIRMDVTHEITATLRAEAHHPPVVMSSAAFRTENSADAHSIGYEEEKSPTLCGGVVPATVYENHSHDNRYTGPKDKAPTILSNYGTGGNNQPFVVKQEVFGICSKDSNSMKSENPSSGTYEADTSRTLDANGGNPNCNQGGMAIVETVKTFDVRQSSDGTQNMRNHAYESDTSRTVDRGGNMPGSNQGGIAVVSIQGSMIGRKYENGPQGSGIGEDVSFTLNTVDRHAVAYGIDLQGGKGGANYTVNFAPTLCSDSHGTPHAVCMKNNQDEQLGMNENTESLDNMQDHQRIVCCSSKGSFHTQFVKELAPSLLASDYKEPLTVYGIGRDANKMDKNAKFGMHVEEEVQPTLTARGPGAVGAYYTVRRLTPTECARLQGFPDWWCASLETPEPTDEEIQFWTEVFETHRRIMGTARKARTRNQIIKWLKNPHTDSAEYKMWGNGVALPCVFFVLAGVVYFAE